MSLETTLELVHRIFNFVLYQVQKNERKQTKSMPTITKIADALDWPDEDKEMVTIECAGESFLEFYRIFSSKLNISNFDGTDKEMWFKTHPSKNETNEIEIGTKEDNNNEDNDISSVDLFTLSETELKDIDYYKVLRIPCRPTITPDDVKKAYRKACLMYHPDKSGRGEDDAVFLKVKTAFETLSTQKRAYDSTEMPFDDSIPSEKTYSTLTFFDTFEPVFRRNLHFDSRLLSPANNLKQSNTKRNSRRSSGSSRNVKNNKKVLAPPSLGDMSTPIEAVHEYYDHWIHFESWRDFSLQAARELETQEHLDNAESRYEKRWFQKEIDRHAKKLKQTEVSRITQLVERAMAVDPRLIQERKRLVEEKERKQSERKQEILDKKKKEEDARLAEKQRIEEEKKRKAEERMFREKEKKMMRKVKQAFKRHVSSALQELKQKDHALEDEVDLICNKLNRLKLIRFNSELESKSASEVISFVKTRTKNIQNGKEESESIDNCDTIINPPGNKSSNIETNHKEERKRLSPSTGSSNDTNKKIPFTKEELLALAKGVKKFPAGGNRWDLITNYVNNVCQSEDLRSKEECIEIFNKANKTGSSIPKTNGNNITNVIDAPDCWSPDQDKQLQKGLQTYPSSMEKNDRWSSIANEVTGKSKKECVARFKVIRNALKAKK